MKKLFLMMTLLVFLNPILAVSAEQSDVGILDSESFNKLSAESKLDLIVLKSNPKWLDNKYIMEYFILLNACATSDELALKSLGNEFTEGKYVDFYKSNSKKVFDSVNSTVVVRTNKFYLGRYNKEKKGFPFVNGIDSANPINLNTTMLSVRTNRGFFFQGYDPITTNAFRCTYKLDYNPISFEYFPIDPESAEALVSTIGNDRGVYLELKIDIEKVVTAAIGADKAVLSGKVKTVTLLTMRDETLGVLYEKK